MPHIPSGRVTLAAVSGACKDVIVSLHKNGVRTLTLDTFCGDNIESTHADMRILHTGGGEVMILAGDHELNRRLTALGFSVTVTERCLTEFKYPECAALNCLLCGGTAFGNFKRADPTVTKFLEGYTRVNVRQGYTKCSAAVVREDALITADVTISKAAEHGIDVLRISPGDIYLCEKYGGFIGGSCFLIDEGTLAFFGELSEHRDAERIKAFCRNHGVYTLNLCGGALTDVGGAVQLLQD